VGHLPLTEDKESLSSDHEILWSEEELDRHSEVTIKKLFNGTKNIDNFLSQVPL